MGKYTKRKYKGRGKIKMEGKNAMLSQVNARIPNYVMEYINTLINIGIFPNKSQIVRTAVIEYLDRNHFMLPEIKK
jgi:metal-responsive CopG/Arc/MetJ family transcriptional regulator